MSKFLKLTASNAETGQTGPIYLQSVLIEILEKIETDSSDSPKTGIYMMSGHGYAVMETVEEILKMIDKNNFTIVNK